MDPNPEIANRQFNPISPRIGKLCAAAFDEGIDASLPPAEVLGPVDPKVTIGPRTASAVQNRKNWTCTHAQVPSKACLIETAPGKRPTSVQHRAGEVGSGPAGRSRSGRHRRPEITSLRPMDRDASALQCPQRFRGRFSSSGGLHPAIQPHHRRRTSGAAAARCRHAPRRQRLGDPAQRGDAGGPNLGDHREKVRRPRGRLRGLRRGCMRAALTLMADFPRRFLGFCGPDLPYTRFNHCSVISAAHQEITDALVSDRHRPRLFPDHSVDRPGAGDRLEALANVDRKPRAGRCANMLRTSFRVRMEQICRADSQSTVASQSSGAQQSKPVQQHKRS